MYSDHRMTRAKERYGVTITPKEMNRLDQDVRCGRGRIVKTLRDGATWQVLDFKGVDLLAVVGRKGLDGRERYIATFLPIEDLEQEPQKLASAAREGKMRVRSFKGHRTAREHRRYALNGSWD